MKTATEFRIASRLRDGLPADYVPLSSTDRGTHGTTECGRGWMPYLKAPFGRSDHSILPDDHPGFETESEAREHGLIATKGDSALSRGYTLAVREPSFSHEYLSSSSYLSERVREELERHSLREDARFEMERE